jgi:pimeloyl-ACP methyl ester carboxylesterase
LLISAQTLLWLVLFVFYLIPIGFGVDQSMKSVERAQYTAPGSHFNIHNTANNSETIRMHMFCTGGNDPSSGVVNTKPTILIEADFGTSGFAYFNLQRTLSSAPYDWRVCAYDRPGYGWSDMSPLGSTVTVVAVDRLRELLDVSGE